MLNASIIPLDITRRTKEISVRRHSSSALTDSPTRKAPELIDEARAAMTKHLETVLKKKFLDDSPSNSNIRALDKSISTDDQSSPSETPNPNERQIVAFSKIVENLLFVSASSAEEYEDTSTLDERLRYIVIRCLKRKLQLAGRKRLCDTARRTKTFKMVRTNVATMS